VDGNAYLSLGVRLDEAVTKARLHLNYRYPLHCYQLFLTSKVYLNDEVLVTLPVTKESLAGPQNLILI